MANPWDNDPIVGTAGGAPNAATQLGRPVITTGPKPVAPSLPQGYTTDPNAKPALPTPGLPREFTMPDKFEPAGPADLKPLGISGGPYLVNRKTGEVKLIEQPKEVDRNDPVQQAIKNLGLDELLTNTRRAREQVDTGWATGLRGAAGGIIPGSARNNFLGILEGLKGGLTLEKLQALKDASKTGASGMGSLTESEGERLASSVAALGDQMSAEEFRRSLDIVEHHAAVLRAIQSGKNPADPAVQKEFDIKPIPELKDKKDDQAAILPVGGSAPGPLVVDVHGDRRPWESQEEYEARSRRGDGPPPPPPGWNGPNGGGNGGGGGQPIPDGGPNLGEQFLQGTKNDIAGLAQGAGSLIDVPTKVLGSAMALPADALGFHDVAQSWRNPTTIGGMVEKVAPTPQDWPGWLARKASEFAGGGAALPARAQQFLAEQLVGKVPEAGNYLGRIGELTPPRIAQAADQEGVRIPQPMVDASKRAKMGYLESTIGGGQAVRQGMDTALGDIEAKASQLGSEGVAQERGLMGQRVQDAMRGNLAKQRADASAIYSKADELAGGAPVYGREIAKQLDTDIAKLQRNPNVNKALIDYLNEVKADFVNSDTGGLVPKTVADLRDIRTNLSGEINRRNLTKTPAEAIISRALNMGKKDISRDMLDAGPNGRIASDLYREGDVRWRLAKMDERQLVDKLIGPADAPISGKDAISRAVQWLSSSGENGTYAARFWNKLSKQDQQDFAATVASTFGRKAPDEPFSAAQFIAATRTIPPSSRKLLFGDEGAQSIANLRALTKAYQDTSRFLNHSRSGVVINWGRELSGIATRGGISGAIGSAVGGAVGGVPGAVVGGTAGAAIGAGSKLLAEKLSARSLMNTDLSKWLAMAPRQTTEQGIMSHIGKLTSIAAKNPAIANDVLDLQHGLMQSLASPGPSMGRIAASPDHGPDNSNQ